MLNPLVGLNRLVTSVTVSGKPLKLIVDTGAPNTVLFQPIDLTASQQTGWTQAAKFGSNEKPAFQKPANKLSLEVDGVVVATVGTMIRIASRETSIKYLTECGAHGVLGMDLLIQLTLLLSNGKFSLFMN